MSSKNYEILCETSRHSHSNCIIFKNFICSKFATLIHVNLFMKLTMLRHLLPCLTSVRRTYIGSLLLSVLSHLVLCTIATLSMSSPSCAPSSALILLCPCRPPSPAPSSAYLSVLSYRLEGCSQCISCLAEEFQYVPTRFTARHRQDESCHVPYRTLWLEPACVA